MGKNENMHGNRWIASMNELRSRRSAAFCGVMCALAIALGAVSTVNIGPYIKIGLSGLPNQVVDYLFGPATGAFFSGALEVLKFLLRPDGVYFPGFTLSAVVAGVVYGFAFYRKPVTLLRVVCANVLVKLIVNIGLNTIWLSILYKEAATALFPARILANLVRLPCNVIVTYALLKAVERVLPKLTGRR